MAVDAVDCEPVSNIVFTDNRGIYRELYRYRAIDAICTSDPQRESKACAEIPYQSGQGILLADQGSIWFIRAINREFFVSIDDQAVGI
jgi:hypothetical protein